MSKIALAALTTALFALGSANAATIEVRTGYSNAGVQASAADYVSIVDAAVATAANGYGARSFAQYDNVTNTFGSNTDIAFKSTILFGVAAGDTGSWSFRAGVDFGNGGAVYLDGVAVATKSNDMWWSGSYANTSQSFQFDSAIQAGNHTLTLYGLENCCNGGQQVQFNAGNGFQTFSNATLAPVPEPETFAMLLAGLGLVGFAARKRQA